MKFQFRFEQTFDCNSKKFGKMKILNSPLTIHVLPILASVFDLISLSFSADMIDRRVREFNGIGRYELIDLSFDKEANVLSFTAFENNYSMLLTVNENIIFGNMKHHINGEEIAGTVHENNYITGLQESCHHHINQEQIKARNYIIITRNGDNNNHNNNNNDNNKDDEIISGAISMCNRRGVRGQIHGFDDTIIIHPAKYF